MQKQTVDTEIDAEADTKLDFTLPPITRAGPALAPPAAAGRPAAGPEKSRASTRREMAVAPETVSAKKIRDRK